MSDSLDFSALAASSLWDDYLNTWIELYRKHHTDLPSEITEASKKLIARAKTHYPDQVKSLVRTLVQSLVEMKLLGPAASVASFQHGYNIAYNEYSPVAQRLLNAVLLPGKPAPPIAGLSSFTDIEQRPVNRTNHGYTSDTTAGEVRLSQKRPDGPPEATLLFFYESRCRSCQAIVAELAKNREELEKRKIWVICISGDTDPKVFDEYAGQLQWADVLCDYKSFEGPNFVRYDVASTPTLYVIDRHGRVVDQYESLSETRLLK